MNDQGKRIQLLSTLQRSDSLVGSAGSREILAVPTEGKRIGRIELDRLLEFPLGAGPVLVVKRLRYAQGGMGLGQSIVDLQGPDSCGLGLWVGVSR